MHCLYLLISLEFDKNFDNQEVLDELDQFVERFRELGLNPEEDYKTAFVSLLSTIADDESKFYEFTSNPELGETIDSIFEKINDHSQLKYENVGLTRSINMLADPGGFAEHVDRNFQWMSDLYNNRSEYYKEVVNQQIQDVEYNSLLADLADIGIYVDLDEFADFVETGKIPTHFIDSVNNRIINEDSVLWDEYVDKFYMALENRDSKPAGDKSTLEEQLEERIRERRVCYKCYIQS